MPFSYDTFLSCCQGNVSESKYKLLQDLTLSSTEGPLVSEWSVFYGNLMKELNYQRSMRLGKPYSSAFDKEPTAASVAASALSAKNPLEAEKILLDYEFDFLDTLTGLHTFDDYVLFGYAIKLKLLERQSCFEHEKGKQEFSNLFNIVQQRVLSL
jgi:hypothetical protein